MDDELEITPTFAIPDITDWRYRLNEFVRFNQQELAALAWGLWQEQGDNAVVLGVDLQPSPHFICCSRAAIATLNTQVENRLQTALAVVEAHNPEKEVLILGIGQGDDYQFQFIQYQPEPPPPTCFEQVGESPEPLFLRLEAALIQHLA